MRAVRAIGRLDPRGWPVRARLAVVSATLTFLILLSFAFVVGRLAADKLDANFREEAQSNANLIASRVNVEVNPATGQLFLQDQKLGNFPLPSGSGARVVNSEGEPLRDAYGMRFLGPVRERAVNVGDLTVATQEIADAPPLLGTQIYIQYWRDRDSLEATIDRLWFFLGAGVLGGTLLALLAGLAVAQRAMNPIAALTGVAREVATTRDPSRRIPKPSTDDEIAELATTLDEMLKALNVARTESEQMMQAQRDFVADASHELRTPLTSILANLELLQARLEERSAGERDTEDAQIVAGALGSSRRMRRLVADLLVLARADAGRAGPRRPCDLVEVADAAIGEIRAVAGTHSLALEAGGPVVVTANRDDIHRLIANLLENAVRHTPPGTNVVASVREAGDTAVIEVVDDGPGLPPGLGDRIFSRFVRGVGPSDQSASQGTGLGLSIVKAVAVAHGGDVTASSPPGGGARFTVRIPLGAHDEEKLTFAPIELA